MLLFGGTLSLFACKLEHERCVEINTIIEAKTTQFPKYCQDDHDCRVFKIHPELRTAASSKPYDPSLIASVDRYEELCRPEGFTDPGYSYEALCIESMCTLFSNEPDPEAEDTAEDQEPELIEEVCQCQNDDNCEENYHCLECICIGPCHAGCRAAEGCDALIELGLGSTVSHCIEQCEEAYEHDPENNQELLDCLSRSTCEEQPSCVY